MLPVLKTNIRTCQCNGRFHFSPCIALPCTAPKEFVTHHPLFHLLNCLFAVQIQGVAATKWRAIPSSTTSSKEISAFALLLPCLAGLATGNSKKVLYCHSLAKIDKIFLPYTQTHTHTHTGHTHRSDTHTHTSWLLRLELKLLAKKMILLAPLQPACPRQGTSWT